MNYLNTIMKKGRNMIIIKFKKISLKELKESYDKESINQSTQVLVFSHSTDRFYFDDLHNVCNSEYTYKMYLEEEKDGWVEFYIQQFKGKEICTDDIDFQDELDDIDILNDLSKEMKDDNDDLDDEILIDKMYDDGIFNYGEEQ